MAVEPTEVETSRLDELAKIAQEQAALRDLTERAKAFRDRAVEVCERVVRDYQGRMTALEQQAQDLREKARQDLSKLIERHGEASRAVEKARFEQQEIDFRYEIGELNRADYPERRKAIDEQLARAEADFGEVDGLCRRFTEALKDPSPSQPVAATRLAMPAVEIPPLPPRGADPRADLGTSSLWNSSSASSASPAESAAPGGADLHATPPNSGPPPTQMTEPVTPGGTIAMAPAFLREEVIAGAEGPVHPLSFVTTIGRTPDNQVTVAEPEVSRHHARITLRESGFVVEDLRSGNGTYLNGVRLSGEQHLKDGDRVQIGSRTFVFNVR